jgi:hypothetical protein
VACTLDVCNAGVCSNTPDDASCDDGDVCTADSCDQVLGCVAGPLTDPIALVSGDILLGDRTSDRIVQFDSSGSFITCFDVGPPIFNIGGLAAEDAATIVVGDEFSGEIVRIDSSGAFVEALSLPPLIAGTLGGLTVDPTGNLLVGINENNGVTTLETYSANGTLLSGVDLTMISSSDDLFGLAYQAGANPVLDLISPVPPTSDPVSILRHSANGTFVTHLFSFTEAGPHSVGGLVLAPDGTLLSGTTFSATGESVVDRRELDGTYIDQPVLTDALGEVGGVTVYVPEPSGWLLLVAGVGLLAVLNRRRARA